MAAPARLAGARPRPRAAGLDPAVRDPAGDRRPDRAGHLAVDLPGRPQRRQPHPPGAVLVPRAADRLPPRSYWSVLCRGRGRAVGVTTTARGGRMEATPCGSHNGAHGPTPTKRNACGHGTQAPGDQRRPAEPASGHRPRGNQRVGRVARRSHRRTRRQTSPLRDAAPARAGAGAPGRRPAADHHRLHQHHPAGAGALVPRRRVRRAADPGVHPVERRDAGAPRAAPGDRRRRPHLDLRVSSASPLRGGLQPLLPRQGPPRRRRPDLLPGPRLPRHVRPRVPRGPADRGPAGRVPAGAVAPAAAACRPTRTRG